MLSIKFSNVTKLRINNYIINEYNYILYKSLYCNLKLYSFFFREFLFFNYNFKLKNCHFFFKRICFLSGRTRSSYSFFNLSRIKLRDLMSFRFLSGLRKSS